ncbi:MAG: radical SAM protein [Elusimicrobiota bacterium]
MRIGLVYPPSPNRTNECFTLPSLSLAALAASLRRAGHEVRFFDFDIRLHSALRETRLRERLGRVPDYLRGTLPAREAAGVESVRGTILDAAPLERCDLYGITMVDLMKELFLLNAAALIAREIKDRFQAPVVLGYNGVPREVYRHILERYPVFDYAIWGSVGETALLRLIERLEGKDVRLVHALARDGDGIAEHGGELRRTACCGSDYRGYPLEEYRVRPAALFERYAAPPRLARSLAPPAADAGQLVVMYQFEETCAARCAFCVLGGSRTPVRRSVEEVVEDLLGLKRLGVTGVFFVNPNFNDDYDFASRLCDRMIEAGLGLQWADCANFWEFDEALLRKMRAAGAVKLVFGMETASRRLLKYIRKAVTRERIESRLRLSHALGIWNHIELIAGLPTETDSDIEETTAFIRDNARHIDTFALNPFYLYKTAPLYREARAFGIRPQPEAIAVRDYFSVDGGVGNISEKFDEVGGLAWPEKALQIRRSTRALAEAVRKASSIGAIDHDHVHLLMYLYARLGHGRKDLIRRVFKRCTRAFKPYHMANFYTCERCLKEDFVWTAR